MNIHKNARATPHHSTIWRFRQELAAPGPAEALFEEINRQLDARGLSTPSTS